METIREESEVRKAQQKLMDNYLERTPNQCHDCAYSQLCGEKCPGMILFAGSAENKLNEVACFMQKELINMVLYRLSHFSDAAADLIIAWILKEIIDLIAGTSSYSIETLGFITCAGLGMVLAAGVINYIFLARFRTEGMLQYRRLAFSQLLNKRIHAFNEENTARYISALSNDATAIEREFLVPVQAVIQSVISFVGAIVLMLYFSPLLTLIAILLMLLPVIVTIILGDKAAAAANHSRIFRWR